nr:uncharacterized protein LOC109189836 [Ipomoea trifida]
MGIFRGRGGYWLVNGLCAPPSVDKLACLYVPEHRDKLLLHEYFKGVGDGFKSGMCLSLETKKMPMKWRDTRNKIDCGVYLMWHMESYSREGVGSWECGLTKGDRAELNRLRWHYIAVSKKASDAPSEGCSSQLPNDDDDFVDSLNAFLDRLRWDSLWDAPDTNLTTEEQLRFSAVEREDTPAQQWQRAVDLDFVWRLRWDPLWDAPDTNLTAEEQLRFPSARIRIDFFMTLYAVCYVCFRGWFLCNDTIVVDILSF